MALVSLQQVSLAFGGRPLLDEVNLQLEPGERICLLGRNGEGKSTLLRLLNGEVEADGGEIVRQKGLRCACLEQEVPAELRGTVYQVAAGGPGPVDSLHLEKVLSRLDLPAEQEFGSLSGGLKRRVLLARALAGDPELLLLDEPTNHLDIAAITRMEEILLNFPGALLFVTHDRQLVRRLATRIIELDRGRLTSWPGDYDNYLRRRDERLAAEQSGQAKFDRKLAEEEAWIRQGIKARRTRNQGRVEALRKMRRDRAARREQSGRVKMQIQDGTRSGRLVAEAKELSFTYGAEPVISGLTTTIMRGDKVGIIGPNGVGKSTLLRLLLGQLAPTAGHLRLGVNLEICYFDQQREQLDPARTVADNLAEGRDTVLINGQSRHVLGYLKDFLFTPERARSPVAILSGGEKNRLLLARLFTRPCNVLVMDEPTNDLDVETLELLEELLLDFKGTLLLVSHDRAFLDNVVTSTLVFEGQGRVVEYAGGYQDWLRQRAAAEAAGKNTEPAASTRAGERGNAAPAATGEKERQPAGLSFTEKHELAELPAKLEALEAEQEELSAALAEPDFYRRPAEEITDHQQRLQALQEKLEAAYQRWEELEEKAQAD
ncbi:ATP-binding cassette domain-containing protein [Desulfurivibrio alkaliphilus]|uniref:ATP-binding protein Uup n=1 Tax=Desulfurivibrio alkaliphilus (strain DSM 19089 / UNIQEM U267 / AHT2) TaxID=589865 RepID=D6Z057_DESAT|nr:ATP-binding cassette domain-containing protein [Desulfurivibrio alkaliphilus]ADH87090.1 ABC transporter related protein [Desulfurivibrio alkaliphilus AHT 2]